MTCAICHRTTDVMLGMEPGRDGKPWALCAPCWRDGVRTVTDTTPAPIAPRKGRR